jgi:LmbE family N-acetylglucosaminyl deacetylase
MNVVSILAHADDEMRCLGTMLKCRERGDKLTFVTVTDGCNGFVQDPTISRAEAASIRESEMRALAFDLGAEAINIGELDEFLFDTAEVRLKVIETIRRTGADLIFTHAPEDYNLDHTTVHSLVRHCAMLSCLTVVPTDSPPLAAHPAIFMVEPHGPFAFTPSHYVDITAQHPEKVRLLSHHASQEVALRQGLGYGLGELTTKLAAYRGEQAGCELAEAFLPMPARGAIKPFNVLP